MNFGVKVADTVITNSLILKSKLILECIGAPSSELILPSSSGRAGQYLALINGELRWIDHPDADAYYVEHNLEIPPDQSEYIVTTDYTSEHSNVYPIVSLSSTGDTNRYISHHLIQNTYNVVISTKANMINRKFSNLSGLYRNLKVIQISNGMLMIALINESNELVLYRCLSQDGDGAFISNLTNIIIPINIIDIQPLPNKRLGIVHNDAQNNIILTSCNLPDGNGVRQTTVVDSTPITIIKLVTCLNDMIVISYISRDGYLYYSYMNPDVHASFKVELLNSNQVILGILDTISYSGKSVAIGYYHRSVFDTDSYDLMLSFNDDVSVNSGFSTTLVRTTQSTDDIRILHHLDDEFLIISGRYLYYQNNAHSFDLNVISAKMIDHSQVCLVGIQNTFPYFYTYDYIRGDVIAEGIIASVPNIIEMELFITSTYYCILAYLNNDEPGVIVSSFRDRFAQIININMKYLIK